VNLCGVHEFQEYEKDGYDEETGYQYGTPLKVEPLHHMLPIPSSALFYIKIDFLKLTHDFVGFFNVNKVMLIVDFDNETIVCHTVILVNLSDYPVDTELLINNECPYPHIPESDFK
jgi:hypothetical protein